MIIVVDFSVPVPEPIVPMEPPSPSRTYKKKEEMIDQVLQLYFVRRYSMRKIASILGMSHMSVYRMLSDPNVEILI